MLEAASRAWPKVAGRAWLAWPKEAGRAWLDWVAAWSTQAGGAGIHSGQGRKAGPQSKPELSWLAATQTIQKSMQIQGPLMAKGEPQ